MPVNFDSASNLISENEPFSSPDVEVEYRTATPPEAVV